MLVRRPGSTDPSVLQPAGYRRQYSMSTTEALRTRLDALQTAENRRLREAEPEKAQLVDVEGELAQTREENVCLAQQISELRWSTVDEEARLEEERDLKETMARLEDKAADRERQLDSYEARLGVARADLETATARALEAERSAGRAKERLDYVQEKAELDRLRAITDETRKWEEREARLVRHLEELEQEARAGKRLRAEVSASTEAGSDFARHEVRADTCRSVTVVTPVSVGRGELDRVSVGVISTTPVPRSPVGSNSVSHSPLSIVQSTTSPSGATLESVTQPVPVLY